MKKVLALALAAAMALSMVACSSAPASEETTTATTYKAGMGIVVSATEAAAEEDAEGQSQINTTVALVVFDAEDKIVSAEIDVAQQTTKWDATGAVTTSAADELRTKAEKEYDYNMLTYGGAVAEWFEQVDAFETWMVGKTFDEVVNMEFTTNSHNYADTPADEDLKASCTMSMTAFLEAITAAHENAEEVTGLVTAGLGSDVTATVSAADAETEGSAQVNSTWSAIALDEAGNIVWAKIDTAQQTTKWDATGAVTANADLRTKYEKGTDYGMFAAWGSQLGEWFEQIDALTAWMTGKTVDAVVNMEFAENGHGYTDTPADEDLKAGCTMSMTSFLAAIAQANELQK